VPIAHNCTVSREEWDVQFSDVFEQIKADVGGRPNNTENPDVVPPPS
jgi:hypothetical protein